MMKILDTITDALAHVLEFMPKLMTVLQSVTDVFQNLADTLKKVGK